MLICAAGDIHGAMDRLYQDVFAFEASLGIRFDYILHVGDFGGRCRLRRLVDVGEDRRGYTRLDRREHAQSFFEARSPK